MNTRKGSLLTQVNNGTLGEDAMQSQPEDTPPARFLSEMDKGFSKIHDMLRTAKVK